MRNHYRLGLLAALTMAASTTYAQMTLVKNGKAKTRIVLANDNAINREAADMLSRFVNKISGTTLPIVSNTATRGAIVIGEATPQSAEDAFSIDCKDGNMHINTGGGKGAVYGVVTLLEKYMGVNYYAYKTYTFTPATTIDLPEIHMSDKPAFRFRQTHSYGCQDPDFERWFRLENSQEEFAGNLWVHTFNQILPAAIYGEKHPEYYSYINGKRRPGSHSQWCLTNPEVFELAAQKIDSIFKANPGMKMISVSQNDGNNTQCHCEACAKVDEYEGAPSGNLIRFVNKLAQRFPDKQFSTLAYLYSMHPPKHTKPLPNVNIMLCDIDCKREVPLTDNESGRDFMRALEGWSKISNNIFVWDYGINFDNMVSPFPNFHIIQKNMQLFKKNHATMIFEQINGGNQRGTDFGEMRAYMMAKLMWNPYQDADSLMKSFMQGYYGAAAPYIYKYQTLLTGALLSSHTPLWIYDSPITHKNGMLNDNLIKMYAEIFDQAEATVASDSTLLAHVQTARLPLRYSELEIARTKSGQDPKEISGKLETFRQQCEKYGITSLNERNNRADDYCNLYKKRFLPRANSNKAAGAKVIWNSEPNPAYRPIADKALTDGLYGGTSYVESWVGWEGRNADFILDMGSEKTFSKITTDFLQQLGAWVLLPKSVSYSYSKDNKTYTDMGKVDFAEDRDISVKFIPGTVTSATPVTARYIRVKVETIGLCPTWHYGVGYPAWFFLDEVNVE